MKRVIFSTYDHLFNPYYHGGGARAIHEIARRLSAYYDVTILTAPYQGSKTRVVDDVKYRYISPTINHPQLGQLIFQASLLVAIKKTQFDIWIENFTPPFSTSFLPTLTSKPVVGLVHLLAGKTMAKKYHLPIFTKIEKYGLQNYNHLIALTSTSRNLLMDINPESHIYIIPNGVQLTKELKISAKRNDWLFLGRIDFDQKGLAILLEVFNKVASRHPWKLLIAGSGSSTDVKRLRSAIKNHPYQNRILYIGETHGVAKQKLLAKAGALVMPSRYETQPLVVLESFAAGCPVLMSDIPDLEWIPNSCCWKAPRSVESFAVHMASFYKHQQSDQRSQKIQKAWNFVQDYDWDKVALKYRKLIEDLIPSSTELKGVACASS